MFKPGDKVVDRDGRDWTIRDVVHHDGSHWYEVRRYDGRLHECVRYESDLKLAMTWEAELELRAMREHEILVDIACHAMRFLERDWPEHIECNLVDLRKAVEEWLALP